MLKKTLEKAERNARRKPAMPAPRTEPTKRQKLEKQRLKYKKEGNQE